jgi:site-specific recombinase XerD
MAAPSVDDLGRSFERYLRAGNKSPRTIETYLEAVGGFTAHLAAASRRSLDQARRENVEAWIGALLARWKPSTAHNRYRGLHAFYRWLEDEEDIPSLMAMMKPPAVADQSIPVLAEPQLRALIPGRLRPLMTPWNRSSRAGCSRPPRCSVSRRRCCRPRPGSR